jgi:hypothetical protein
MKDPLHSIYLLQILLTLNTSLSPNISPASLPTEKCIFPFDDFSEQVSKDKEEYNPLLSAFSFNNFNQTFTSYYFYKFT